MTWLLALGGVLLGLLVAAFIAWMAWEILRQAEDDER